MSLAPRDAALCDLATRHAQLLAPESKRGPRQWRDSFFLPLNDRHRYNTDMRTTFVNVPVMLPRCRRAVGVLLAVLGAEPAVAQIYRWDNGAVIPDTAGIVPGPGANFAGINLDYGALASRALDSANFSSASLVSAQLTGTRLSGADLRGASIAGAFLDSTTSGGFTAEQLYSTASYRADPIFGKGNLNGIRLGGNALDGWNFERQRLVGASFVRSSLTGAVFDDADPTSADFSSANLTSASFRGAFQLSANFTNTTIRGADFTYESISAAQLYSTGSYQNRDLRGLILQYNNLTGWNFTSQDLSYAVFDIGGGGVRTRLTSAAFDGAIIRGTNFGGVAGRRLTAAQLYSTASYQNRDLREIKLAGGILNGWNFAGQNLTAAALSRASLVSADFTLSDLRQVVGFTPDPTTVVRNAISPDGTVAGLALLAGDVLAVRDNVLPVSVKNSFSMNTAATLRFVFTDSDFTSPVNVEVLPGFAGTLALDLGSGVSPDSLVGVPLDLFNFGASLPVTTFDNITSNLDAAIYSWETSQLYSTGIVRLQVIPDPTALSWGAVVGLAIRRRRTAREGSGGKGDVG